MIDIWISKLSIMSSLNAVFMAEGSFIQKEKERVPLSKSRVVLIVLVPSTIKYLNYGILSYCFLYVVEPLEKVIPLCYH